ncbi:hypothetical protein BD410DRAFT_807416 [Rickenella mellea]|uniref:Uncharacterized protein n=1 Tax=Rickenella mellea TaxID=50990 RepID=A0A4Y7PPA8_9AGAM|nr:hypothetical protein BD410DRAFT_807416 [Rickenella mellea]
MAFSYGVVPERRTGEPATPNARVHDSREGGGMDSGVVSLRVAASPESLVGCDRSCLTTFAITEAVVETEESWDRIDHDGLLGSTSLRGSTGTCPVDPDVDRTPRLSRRWLWSEGKKHVRTQQITALGQCGASPTTPTSSTLSDRSRIKQVIVA